MIRAPHSLLLALFPVPAILLSLAADGHSYPVVCALAAVAAVTVFRPRDGLMLGAITVGIAALVFFAFLPWIPGDPGGVPSPPGVAAAPGPTVLGVTADRALAASMLASRLAAMAVLSAAPLPFLRWREMRDTMITRFRVPYRVVDVVGVGGVFARILSDDLATAAMRARLNSRGRRWITPRIVVPVLVASFRHADDLALALESRGFGAGPTRTVRYDRPFRPADWGLLLGVWAASVGAYALV
ncbi:Energy-coupling factor transporter transmembrane protein EcfT [Corynebacterium hansenii]|nr:Energy-coupling factor transporter transmembrane protein EcfT [Corynebacterium hansenii]